MSQPRPLADTNLSSTITVAKPRAQTLFARRRRLGQDKSGAAAIEFALVLPFIVLILLGSIEASLLVMADRRVSNASGMLANLVSMDDAITSAEVDDLYAAALATLAAPDVDSVKLRITSLQLVGSDAKVAWSVGKNLTPFVKDTTETVPAGLLTTGGSVIHVEVFMTYTSPIRAVISAPIGLGDDFYMRPRTTDTITGPAA